MNLRYKFLAAGILSLLFVSCTEESNTTAENKEVEVIEEQSEKCLYSFNEKETQIGFTAFKFLNKTGVGGEFQMFSIEHGEAQENPLDVIKSLSFEIPVSALFTKDEGRDEKIKNFFFGTVNIDAISGKVLSLEGEKALLEITMNGITNTVEGAYTMEDAIFNFNSEINVEDWNCLAGVEALNKECHDLHIDVANGDTESKLWSEVEISFSTTLNKNCD